MLAVFFMWMMTATVLTWITVLPPWACAVLAAIPYVVWMYKRPQDF